MRRVMALLFSLTFLVLPAKAAQSRKYVALTFDDGPSGRYTRQLLDGLKERGVKATFLLCGYRVQEYPEECGRIWEEGHEIGLHGFSHKDMRELSRREIAQELMDTEALLPENCRIRFFRPPGGQCGDAVRQVAEARRLAILQWSVDPRDWANADPAAIEQAVTAHVADGDVILLHDMSGSSVKAALNIVDSLAEQGFTFVTASELASLRGIIPKPGRSYHSFPGT